jgi:hypothetical protein
MIGRALRFIRLPLLLILLYAIGRFTLGAQGVPYAPRGNAVFSIVGLTLISSLYFGALSRRLGGLGWGGTALVGACLGFWSQLLIFTATWLSFALGVETSYFRHWDALNLPPDTVATMEQALKIRAPGLLVGALVPMVAALLGRGLFSALAPDPADASRV